MNDLNVADSGLLRKAAELLNNKMFSDCEILVINDGTNPRSYSAHKLFLAMYSEHFAKHFYESSSRTLKIFDFKPKIVFMMLEFLYTNKVNFSETKDARELYTLSKQYGIRNLQELCVEHISRKEVNSDNVLYMYECALKGKYLKCLEFCRQVVSSEMKAVIDTKSFLEASFLVLEDILKLDTLVVDSELDIVHAVIKWAYHECRRRNLNDLCSLRDCMLPLLGHIRFLNLKHEAFCDIVKKYPIFTAQESSLIARKLLQSKEFIRLPPHICQVRRPRVYSTETRVSESEHFDSSDSVPQDPRDKNSRLPYFESRKAKQCPISKVSPQVNVSAQKTFGFSLQEAEKLLSTAFENDVICSVSINLVKGMIVIHGVEIRVEQSSTTEEQLNVSLTALTSEAKLPVIEDTFIKELKDSSLTLLFNQPLKIHQGSRAKIEVMIENLKLNRCSVIKDLVSKLECCSDVVAEFVLASNRAYDKEKHFFLINRLIYSLA